MKQKLLPKYLFAGVIALSLFSFAYVNLHAVYSTQPCLEQKATSPQPVLIEEDDKQTTNIPIPDVTIISRVMNVVQKLATTNR